MLKRLKSRLNCFQHFAKVLSIFFFAGLQFVEDHKIYVGPELFRMNALRLDIFRSDDAKVMEFFKMFGNLLKGFIDSVKRIVNGALHVWLSGYLQDTFVL